MSGSDSQVMKLWSQLRSKLRFSVVAQDRPISAPRARIEPPKPVVAKREIEVKSRVDWLCALRNFDSLISQGASGQENLAPSFEVFEVLELIDSWFNFEFWVSGTRLSRLFDSNLTKAFYPSLQCQVSYPIKARELGPLIFIEVDTSTRERTYLSCMPAYLVLHHTHALSYL